MSLFNALDRLNLKIEIPIVYETKLILK